METRQATIIEHFKSRKILVIGDAILDTYIHGTTDRLCREAPVPVFNVQLQEHSCGGAANTAINLAALGADTYLIAVTGHDDDGARLLHLLHKCKVDTQYAVRDAARTTTAKKRIQAAGSLLLRLDNGLNEVLPAETAAALEEKIKRIYPLVDAVVLSDYGYGVLTGAVMQTLLRLRRQYPKPLIVDSRDLSTFKGLEPDVVKPNYEEALHLLKLAKVKPGERAAQLLPYANDLLALTGAQCVALTLDSEGAVIAERSKEPHRVHVIPRNSKNSVGAGDTFISAFSLALVSGAATPMAAEISATAADVILQKEGTAVCSNDELKACFQEIPKLVPGIDCLGRRVQEWKAANKVVVLTNGCFDLLHSGHIKLLKAARLLGDVLIVALNSDESISRVKGKNRPINTLEDRIMVLAALEHVDYLVSFEEDTAVELVKAIQPQYFVKGGNYHPATLPEAPVVEATGGKVVLFPLFTGSSTQQLIEKIRQTASAAPPVRQPGTAISTVEK